MHSFVIQDCVSRRKEIHSNTLINCLFCNDKNKSCADCRRHRDLLQSGKCNRERMQSNGCTTGKRFLQAGRRTSVNRKRHEHASIVAFIVALYMV